MGTTLLPEQAITVEDMHATLAITYPQAYRTIRVQHAGCLYSISERAFVGRIALGKRGKTDWAKACSGGHTSVPRATSR